MYELADGSWDMDREAADYEQAEMEAAGRDFAVRMHRSRQLRESDPSAAAAICPHGSGYPLSSPAATNSNDPRAGERGIRCSGCGSVIDRWPYEGSVCVLFPCELPAV